MDNARISHPDLLWDAGWTTTGAGVSDGTGTVSGVETDVLGEPYQRRVIDLGNDDEGPVLATLVSRRASAPDGRAVLYVHGYNDYFFQRHLADFYVVRGIDFYAIDLRKCGRSLLNHQTPNYISDISDYFRELDEAARIIREVDGHDRMLVNAHSTGGLTTALWAHHTRDRPVVDAMFLNSPFFEINVPRAKRHTAGPLFDQVARWRPYATVPAPVATAYGHSINSQYHGEWTYELAWKPIIGFVPRAGWLRAIRSAQARLRAGLDLRVPVLVGCSARSYERDTWSEPAQCADAVLDVDDIVRWSPALGRHVTIIRFDGGLHDLTLSAPPVRTEVFQQLDRWLGAYLA